MSDHAQRKVDLNSATREEIEAIPNIGPDEAAAIFTTREKSGPFRNLAEVLQAAGMEEKEEETLRRYATVFGS